MLAKFDGARRIRRSAPCWRHRSRASARWQVRVANCSARGCISSSRKVDERDARGARRASLPPSATENGELIARATESPRRISTDFEALVSSGRITFDELFDNNYVPIDGHQSGAVPHANSSISSKQALPPIQNPVYEAQRRHDAVRRRSTATAICRCTGPSIRSRSGRDEPAWNERNCRNRRIYDDPARLTAARSTRPYTDPAIPP